MCAGGVHGGRGEMCMGGRNVWGGDVHVAEGCCFAGQELWASMLMSRGGGACVCGGGGMRM